MFLKATKFLSILTLLIVVLVGCSVEREGEGEDDAESTATGTEVTPDPGDEERNDSGSDVSRDDEQMVVETESEFIVYDDLEEMVETVEFIFIGTVRETAGYYNLNRDPGNPEEPDPRLFGLGQIYEVEVDDYLKGTGEPIRNVVQSEGFLSTGSPEAGETLTDEELEDARAGEDYIPMSIDEQYLFFVDESSVKPDHLLRLGGAEPWRYRIEDDTAIPEVAASEQDIRAFPILEREYQLDSLLEEAEGLLDDEQ